MVREEKFNQYGFPRNPIDIKGITIHETGNYEMNAQQLFDYFNDVDKSTQGAHYVVDDTQVIQLMPNDWAIYHTGKGKDYGCKYTIAIEICSNINDEKYKEAQDNAVQLIKQLMQQYNITSDDIFLHNDFNPVVHCPNAILNKYGSAKRFVLEEIL